MAIQDIYKKFKGRKIKDVPKGDYNFTIPDDYYGGPTPKKKGGGSSQRPIVPKSTFEIALERSKKKAPAKKDTRRGGDVNIERQPNIKERLELATARARRAGLADPAALEMGAGTGQILSPETEQERRFAEDLRRQAFAEETGSDELSAELGGLIEQQPSLAPEGIGERVAGIPGAIEGATDRFELDPKFITNLMTGKASSEDIVKNAKKFAGALGVVGGAGALAFAIPAVATGAAVKGITGSVLGAGKSVPLLKTAVAGLGIFAVGKSVFDFRGDEMDQLRTQLQKVVEDGERIEAANRNGFPTTDTMSLLTTMSEEIATAEARIKQLGNNNLQYRVSREYITDQQRVRSSREAILRRILAVENVAATGQAQLDPQALMFDVAQFG